MRIAKENLVFLIIAVFVFGALLGFLLKSNQSELSKINPFPGSCVYAGKVYKSGEGFPATDGCNSCSCENGSVACTLIACGTLE